MFDCQQHCMFIEATESVIYVAILYLTYCMLKQQKPVYGAVELWFQSTIYIKNII